VFNLAALLGLSALVAGSIALHRRVIALAGTIAVWIAAVCVLVVSGVLSPLTGLLLSAGALAPYAALLGAGVDRLARLRPPDGWRDWLRKAVHEEEVELEGAIHPARGHARDIVLALASVLVVVGASVGMERTASTLGARAGIGQIVVGGVVLAAATSLPNAVAAVYLATRGRGAAMLSTALNSNAINVLVGLLAPGAIVGVGARSGQTEFAAASYLALTAAVLLTAYASRGLGRRAGALVIGAYLAFVAVLVTIA
jgi:Ca2+/Na+ antiporter